MRVNGQGGLDERSSSAIVSKSPFLMSIVFHGQRYYALYQIAAVCCHLIPSEQTPNLSYTDTEQYIWKSAANGPLTMQTPRRIHGVVYHSGRQYADHLCEV